MPHILVVWTIHDIIGAIFWSILAVAGIMFAALFLFEAAMDRIKRWWSKV